MLSLKIRREKKFFFLFLCVENELRLRKISPLSAKRFWLGKTSKASLLTAHKNSINNF